MSKPVRDQEHLFFQRVTVWKAALNDFCASQACKATDTQEKLEWFLKHFHPEFEKFGPFEEFEFPDPDSAYRDNVCYKLSAGKYLTEEELNDWRRTHSAGTGAANKD